MVVRYAQRCDDILQQASKARSHFGVACAVEESLTPGIPNALSELCCLNRVVNICILVLSIYLATVGHLLVCKLEEVAIDYLITSFFENLEKSGLTLGVSITVELGIGQEVLSVHTVVRLVGQSERANVEACLRCLHSSAHSWLIFIEWGQLDSCVSILPEAAPAAHHITARYTARTQIKVDKEMDSCFALKKEVLTQSGSCSHWSGRSATCP